MAAQSNPLGMPQWAWIILLALTVAMATYVAAGLAALAYAPDPTRVFTTLSAVGIASFGAVLLARHLHHRAAALLGIILIALSTTLADLGPVSAIAEPTKFALFVAIVVVRSTCTGFFWPLFALAVSGGPDTRRQARLVVVVAAIFATMPAAAIGAGVGFGFTNLAAAIWAVLLLGNQLFGYLILARNYRENDAPARNRIKIVLFAFVFFLLSSLAQVANFFFDSGLPVPLVAGVELAGTALLAYAVLRRSLFDFGFAVNRTVVYAVVSFILLAAFGLAEWSTEHLVPVAWHNSGPAISAAIALALFLSFHRLRDKVEHYVERLLFSSWHRNEATLRRFVAAVAHFEQAPALCRAFAAEVSRFAHGAPAALYLREGGVYKRKAGALEGARARLVEDDRALALMRTERRPLRMEQALSHLPGVLALPMLDQGLLSGFVLMGAKGDRSAYRPDEAELLGWAAEQVGFALQGQHLHDLEAKIAELSASVDSLTQERERLAAQLAGSAVRLVG